MTYVALLFKKVHVCLHDVINCLSALKLLLELLPVQLDNLIHHVELEVLYIADHLLSEDEGFGVGGRLSNQLELFHILLFCPSFVE